MNQYTTLTSFKKKKRKKKKQLQKNQKPTRLWFQSESLSFLLKAEFLIYLYWSGIKLGITGSLKDRDECAFKLLIIDYNHILIILWT